MAGLRIGKFLVLGFIFLGAVGCRTEERSGYPVFHLTKVLKGEVKAKLSDVADSVRFIALETTDSCLVGGYSGVLCVNEKGILIFGREGLYLFLPDGTFACSLGRIGRGPGEFNRIRGAYLGEKSVYILEGDRQKIIRYGYDGSLQEETDCPGITPVSQGTFLNDSLLVMAETEYTAEGMKSWMALYDNGKLKTKKLVFQDEQIIKSDNLGAVSIYPLGNEWVYVNNYIDTIYRIDRDLNLRAAWELDLGGFVSDRSLWSQYADWTELCKTSNIYNLEWNETSRFICCSALWGSRIWHCIWDKREQRTIHCIGITDADRDNSYELEDDLYGTELTFYPGETNANLDFYNDFSEKGLVYLQKQGIDLQEEDNPVIRIVYLKK